MLLNGIIILWLLLLENSLKEKTGCLFFSIATKITHSATSFTILCPIRSPSFLSFSQIFIVSPYF
jgi:hypothetical protein